MSYPHLFGPATREGRATAADGVQLAWQVFGEPSPNGFPPVVCCNGLGCSTFFWHYLARYFMTRTQVVVWDYRGHGDSAPAPDLGALGVAQCAQDLAAVFDDVGLDQPATLIGHSMGSQVILEFYRRHPTRVAGLIPLLGTYGKAIDTFFDSSLVKYAFPVAFHVAVRVPWPIQAVTRWASHSRVTFPLASATGMVNGTMFRRKDLGPYMENLAALDLRVFMHLARDMGRHDADDLLPHIAVPVLILGGERDIYTPLHRSEHMHRRIPASEILIIPGGSHGALVEQPELINLRVEKFVTERVVAAGRESNSARELDTISEDRLHAQEGRRGHGA